MQGRMVLKITGILMIIAAAFSILAGIFVGGLGALAAGVGAASGLTGAYWAALFLTLVGGICQLVAGIQGVRYSQTADPVGRDRRPVQHPGRGPEHGEQRRAFPYPHPDRCGGPGFVHLWRGTKQQIRQHITQAIHSQRQRSEFHGTV